MCVTDSDLISTFSALQVRREKVPPHLRDGRTTACRFSRSLRLLRRQLPEICFRLSQTHPRVFRLPRFEETSGRRKAAETLRYDDSP